jgi:DNA-binding beta-propeller fold protein YncE
MDRDLSWFDYGNLPTITADGKVIAFTESGEGAGATYGTFLRPATGEAAVRVADIAGGAVSPDGTKIFGTDVRDPTRGILAPTGAGAPKQLPLKKLAHIVEWAWYPDNRHVVLWANESGHPARSWRLDTVSGELLPITPDGEFGLILSPDGRLLVVGAGSDRYLLNLQTGEKTALKGAEDTLTCGFTADGSAVYVLQRDRQGGQLLEIDIASGTRTLVRTLHPSDPGFRGIARPRVSLDGEHFTYSTVVQTSQLFLLKLP